MSKNGKVLQLVKKQAQVAGHICTAQDTLDFPGPAGKLSQYMREYNPSKCFKWNSKIKNKTHDSRVKWSIDTLCLSKVLTEKIGSNMSMKLIVQLVFAVVLCKTQKQKNDFQVTIPQAVHSRLNSARH